MRNGKTLGTMTPPTTSTPSVKEFLQKRESGNCFPIIQENDIQLWADSSNSLLWIVFDLAGRPVNVLNMNLTSQFKTVFDAISVILNQKAEFVNFEGGPTFLKPQALLITSGKVNGFIVGADIDSIFPMTNAEEATLVSKTCQDMFNEIESLSIPTIALINGSALGGGLELALSCTYRIVSSDANIRLGLPEVQLGLIPGGGGTYRLPRLIGIQNSLGMILPGKAISPSDALKMGLVDASIDHVDTFPNEFRMHGKALSWIKFILKSPIQRSLDLSFSDRVLEDTWIGRWVVSRESASLLDKQTKGLYPASYFALDAVLKGVSLDRQSALDNEARHFGTLVSSSRSKSLISIFYMMEASKKIPPVFNGISDETVSNVPLKSIGVIGAGVMGRQIGLLVARNGYSVYLRDINPEIVEEGINFIHSYFENRLLKGRISQEAMKSIIGRVTGGTDLQPFRNCDLVIEAAVESLELKKRIVAEISPLLSSTCILATNTSSISISSIAGDSSRKDSIVGIHFFNPVARMPLVEIIMGRDTSDLAGALSYNFALSLGKVPVVCRDSAGFIVNRILGIYLGEAGHLLLEHNHIPVIDSALLKFGMPMGPFRLMDEVGLDVAAHVASILSESLGPRFRHPPKLTQLLSHFDNELGVKSGRGIYEYSGSKQIGLNPHIRPVIAEIQDSSVRPCRSQEIVDRCILIALQEAVYILDEGVVSSAAELDLAMIMGTGFAPFRGGILNYADQRGIPEIVSRLRQLEQTVGARFKPHKLLVEMSEAGRLFFPDRPHNTVEIAHIPRSLL